MDSEPVVKQAICLDLDSLQLQNHFRRLHHFGVRDWQPGLDLSELVRLYLLAVG